MCILIPRHFTQVGNSLLSYLVTVCFSWFAAFLLSSQAVATSEYQGEITDEASGFSFFDPPRKPASPDVSLELVPFSVSHGINLLSLLRQYSI